MFSNPFTLRAIAQRPALPAPAWSLYGDGHVLAATIVRDDLRVVEAHITLDGQVLYRSRHATVGAAAEELIALRSQWASDGWLETS